ncbi:MAG: dihydrodipicolinate synthase family protein [Nocardioidaceae bacterium]|nr:MAG: dihydrodipicolinate synthase family protein [Nocardioidaceae bacterium]
MNDFNRLFITPVLPFADDAARVIDEDGYRRLLRYFMQPEFLASRMGVIANPEAGEIFYLSREEKRRIVEITVEECGEHVPVFAGVAGTSTDDCVQVARDAHEAGAIGLFLCPPIGASDVTVSWDAEQYPEIWIDMARAVADAADLPIIAHPVSSVTPRWAQGLPLPATLKMCEEIPQIVGWKMTYSYDALLRVARGLRQFNAETGRDVMVMGASAHWFHDLMAREYLDGVCTGSFSYAMEPMLAHLEAWRREDLQEARRIWNGGMAALHEYVYAEWSRLHIRYKVATWLRGLIDSPLMRPPVPRPKQIEIDTIRGLLEAAGLDPIAATPEEARFL